MTILLAGTLQSSSGGLSSITPAPVTITTENVELNGAGTFAFQPDMSALQVDLPADGAGVSFSARVWFDPTGQPIDCDPGTTTSVDAARSGCAQLMRFSRFKLRQGMDLPYRRGFVDVQFSFYAGGEMFATPRPAYKNVVITYPLGPSNVAMLTPADGRLGIVVRPDDYPPIAMRYGLESSSLVLLGVDRSGSVKTCRPVGDSEMRTAYLDNYTCGLMLKRGKFAFAEGAGVFEGTKYITRKLVWVMPRQ